MIAPALFLIAAAVAVYLLRPLFGQGHPDDIGADAPTPASEDATANALRDLDLDWSTGKLSDDDYRSQRAAFLAEAEARAAISARDDTIRGAGP